MARTQSEDDKNGQITVAGCLLMVLSLVVLGCVAIPVVRWRDPASGQPLPRMLAIGIPVLAWGMCCSIGTAVLKIIGLPVLKMTKTGSSRSDKDVDEPAQDKRNEG